jgi:DNA-binding CsgD family transcriptional regulator
MSDRATAASRSRLRLGDVRRLFRLIGEVRELGADPNVWRPHMVQRLRRLFDAEVAISSEIHFRTGAAGAGGSMRMIDIGWGIDREQGAFRIQTERDNESPETYYLTVGRGPSVPAAPAATETTPAHPTDADPVDPRAADAVVPVVPAKRVYGGTTFVLSQYPLPHAAAVDQLGIHRAGDKPFTPADHRLLRLFHVELGRLWRKDALRRAKDPGTALPPRLQQTLTELLAGSSEKQIALKLELSRHTIHNYVKALHQRFGVSSRGELLAKTGRQQNDFLPKLSLELPRRTPKRAPDEVDARAREGRDD